MDRIDELLDRIPDTFTVRRRQRKSGAHWIIIRAKKSDPTDPFGGRERFEVEGDAHDVVAGLEWWINSGPHRRKEVMA